MTHPQHVDAVIESLTARVEQLEADRDRIAAQLAACRSGKYSHLSIKADLDALEARLAATRTP